MSNIFDFIYGNNNIKFVKDFFKLPVLDLPHDLLRLFLLDWYEEVNKYFTQTSQEKNLDTVYDYFFLLESKKMKNYIHNIKNNESKKKFENILESIENHLSKYKIPEIEEICLCNLDQLLSNKKNYWLKEQFFWFFFSSKSSNIFFKKIKDDDYYQKFIIANFSQIKNIFMQHLNWCIDFFNFEKLKKYLNNGEIIGNWFLDFIINFKDHKNKTIKENYDLFENHLKNYLDIYHKKIENIDDSEWMENVHILENIRNYFIKIKSPNKEKYVNIGNSISKWKDKYLEKYGEKISLEVVSQHDLKKFDNFFNDIKDEKEWFAKLIYLTHQKDKDNKFISNFEAIGKIQKNLMDVLCSNDEYFFITKIENLNFIKEKSLFLLKRYYLLTKKNNIFFEQLKGMIISILSKAASNNYDNALKEIMLLLNFFSENTIKIIDNKECNLELILFSQISITLSIEKILKIFYLWKYPKEKYLERWYLSLNITLGDVSPLNEIFGKDTIKIIRYYLCDSNGINIRNKLMHFDFDYKINEIVNVDNTLLLLYILLTILWSWVLYDQRN